MKGSLTAYVESGAALAQSAYSNTGWAVEQAVADIEALRKYFVQKYGKPRRTFATGHSMGGFLTMMLLESQATIYDGGLSLCGPLTSASTVFTNALNYRVVFDYFFPDALPDLAHVPADFKPSRDLDTKLIQLIKSKPPKAELVRRYMGMKNDDDVAKVVDFLTFQLKDIQERAGGNPVDNRNTIYTLAGADDDFNQRIKRMPPTRGRSSMSAPITRLRVDSKIRCSKSTLPTTPWFRPQTKLLYRTRLSSRAAAILRSAIRETRRTLQYLDERSGRSDQGINGMGGLRHATDTWIAGGAVRIRGRSRHCSFYSITQVNLLGQSAVQLPRPGAN